MRTQELDPHSHVGFVVLGISQVCAQRDQVVQFHSCRSKDGLHVRPDDLSLFFERLRHCLAIREVAVETTDDQQPRVATNLCGMAVAAVLREELFGIVFDHWHTEHSISGRRGFVTR